VTPEELHEKVRTEGLLGSEEPLVAMISGGRDSVCLLAVAVALRGASSVTGLHVNYRLRGDESDEDERLCGELCASLSVELEVVRAEPRTPEPGAPESRETEPGNLQAWARELRYGEALRIASELDGRSGAEGRPGPGGDGPRALVATGHTASDQVETILYRLAASPGRRPLLGMAPREGRVVRPLLGIARKQTAAYCRARGLHWREDESNEDERYARVRVRKRLVPALNDVHPAAQESVLRTASQLREESELLGELVEGELAGRDFIAVRRLAELHPALARLVVVRLAEEAAGDYVPQAGRRVGEILALDDRGGRSEVHVGGSVSAVIEGGELRMVRLPARDTRDTRGDRGTRGD
jgi:tRNA(Ile)-lysidine synthase